MPQKCSLWNYRPTQRKTKGNPFAIANGWSYRHPAGRLFFGTFEATPYKVYFLTPRNVYRHLCRKAGEYRIAFDAGPPPPGFTEIIYSVFGFVEAASTLTAYVDGEAYAAVYNAAGDGTHTMTVPEITAGKTAIIEIQTGTNYRYHEVTEL